MAKKLLLLANSGKGKSTSLRNLDPEKTIILQTVNKELPFRGYMKKYNKGKDNLLTTPNNRAIAKEMVRIAKARKDEELVFIIDDFNYSLLFEYMDKRDDVGFTKFEQISFGTADLIRYIDKLPPQMTVIFMAHTQKDETGQEEFKSVGKFVSEKLVVEGLFTIVFRMDDEYNFITNGVGLQKSPMDMFGEKEPNDLAVVLGKMKQYYEGE